MSFQNAFSKSMNDKQMSIFLFHLNEIISLNIINK